MLKQLKSLAKSVVSPIVDATGVYGRRVRRASGDPGSWTIVMYHRVIDEPSRDPFDLGMCVRRHRFERQIRYLRSNFSILTVGDAVRRVAQGRELPRRALSVTFDDGYLDTLTHAWPVMRRLGVPFSLYVPTGGLEDGEPLWWDRVIAALAGTQRDELDLQEAGLAQAPERLWLKGLSAAENAERVLGLLWAMAPADCERAVERLVQWLGPLAASGTPAERLAPAQIVELRRQGVEIGAHSVHHGNLELTDAGRTRAELGESRRWLEDLLQEPVRGFAFPAGRFNDVTVGIAAEVGFDYALSTQSGVNRPACDPMRLQRIGMPDAELPDFRRALSAAMLRVQVPTRLRF